MKNVNRVLSFIDALTNWALGVKSDLPDGAIWCDECDGYGITGNKDYDKYLCPKCQGRGFIYQ